MHTVHNFYSVFCYVDDADICDQLLFLDDAMTSQPCKHYKTNQVLELEIIYQAKRNGFKKFILVSV